MFQRFDYPEVVSATQVMNGKGIWMEKSILWKLRW